MPSQRLLKMMDPLGHIVSSRRALASTAPKAVVWAAARRLTTWLSAELVAVGIEPLQATSFRHVEASLRDDAGPRVVLAVLDATALSSANVAALTSARWAGYRGAIVAVGSAALVSPETRAIVHIDAVVDAWSPDLRTAAARLLATR